MINVKFYMYFNAERIRTLEDLRKNFFAEDVLEAYSSGQLVKWLKVWRHKEELEQVEAIESGSAREILRDLVRIFDPEAEAEEIDSELSVYDYLEERKKFREYLITHGLDELETLRRENDTLREALMDARDKLYELIRERDNIENENDRLRCKLQVAEQKIATIITTTGRTECIRIVLPQVNTWKTIIPAGTFCRVLNIGNCSGILGVASVNNKGSHYSIECSTQQIFNGMAVFRTQEKDLLKPLCFYIQYIQEC